MSHTVENKSSYEEDLRIEVTEGKFFRTNITRAGDYFVFAGAYLPSKEVDECRKELCEEMTISDFECFQIDCKRQ
ncbi:uncharacterized protein LOC142559586 isoform X3 [Dermacentor variabilis]|uniref:uncharacterized protein LOC142559586 isoform X3 n=1 Tax=Dermacentor variabilis TaxID=34621 RepID=UPI003F5C2613